MSNVKFEMDRDGVRTEILQAPFMLEHISNVAHDYDGNPKVFIGFDRAKALVKENRLND